MSLAVSCTAGGSATSYAWTGGFAGGQTTSSNTQSGTVTQTTTFTVVAGNGAGNSSPASTTVNVALTPNPPPAASAKPSSEQLARLTDTINGNASSVVGYSEIPLAHPTATSGFSAKAFGNSVGDRIVLAIVADDDPLDYLGIDAPFLQSQPSDALINYVGYAVAIVQDLATRFPGAEITLTGHSLGGAIAQLIASASGVNATTFNAPGVAQFLPYFKTSLASLPVLRTPSGAREITNLRAYGDLVSTVGTQVGATLTLVSTFSDSLIDPRPLDYMKHQHLLATVLERIVDNGQTTTAIGPTAASIAQSLISTSPPASGVIALRSISVKAAVDYFIDPEGSDVYLLASDPGRPRFASVTFPVLFDMDAVFRVERIVDGAWTSVGTFEERSTYDFGSSGVDQFRFFVLDRADLRAPASVEPFTFGVRFASDGVFSGTMTRQSTASNYQGMWAVPNLAEAGWGINFTHQDDLIFASWFTYDANGKPWWLTMTLQRQSDGSFEWPDRSRQRAPRIAPCRSIGHGSSIQPRVRAGSRSAIRTMVRFPTP